MFVYRQTQKPAHTSVSVLMVRWDGEDTETPKADTDTLEHLLRERYGYTIHRYNITSCARASLKLGVRIRSFLESQRPEHLLVVYYAGRSVLGTDNELYWTRCVLLLFYLLPSIPLCVMTSGLTRHDCVLIESSWMQ